MDDHLDPPDHLDRSTRGSVTPTRPPAAAQRASDDEIAATWRALRGAVATIESGTTERLAAARLHKSVSLDALRILAAAPRRMAPMTTLAAAAGLTSGGMTKVVDRLAERGYVERRHSRTDRRVVFAILTDEGVEVHRRSGAAYSEALRRGFENLPAGSMSALRAMCERLGPRR